MFKFDEAHYNTVVRPTYEALYENFTAYLRNNDDFPTRCALGRFAEVLGLSFSEDDIALNFLTVCSFPSDFEYFQECFERFVSVTAEVEGSMSAQRIYAVYVRFFGPNRDCEQALGLDMACGIAVRAGYAYAVGEARQKEGGYKAWTTSLRWFKRAHKRHQEAEDMLHFDLVRVLFEYGYSTKKEEEEK